MSIFNILVDLQVFPALWLFCGKEFFIVEMCVISFPDFFFAVHHISLYFHGNAVIYKIFI